MQLRLARIFFALFLLGLGFSPAFGVLAQSAPTTFFVESDFDVLNRSEITASPVGVFEHSRIYVETEYFGQLSAANQVAFTTAVNAAAQQFDTLTYPGLRDLFGSEPRPGIDNDDRLSILFTPMVQDFGGYVNTGDLMSASSGRGNEQEMFYVNAKVALDARLPGFMAHEFQHLISHQQKFENLKLSEEVWLNELRSEYAPIYLNLFTGPAARQVSSRLKAFLNDPSDGLMEWQNDSGDYGSVAIFGYYLGDRFGAPLFRTMTRVPSIGKTSIESGLKAFDINLNFDTLYGQWLAALLVNNPNFGSAFSFKQAELRGFTVPAPTTVPAPNQINGFNFVQVQGEPYTPIFIDVLGSATLSSRLDIISKDSPLVFTMTQPGAVPTVEILPQNKAADFYLKPGVTARLAIANISSSPKSRIEITLTPAPVLDVSKVVITDQPVVVAGEPVRLILGGGVDLSGAKLSVNSLAADLSRQPDGRYQAIWPSGFSAGEYEILVGRPGESLSNLGMLKVGSALADGRLYAGIGESFTFVKNGSFWRPLVDDRIVNLYNHFAGQEPILVLPGERSGLIQSRLVKAAGDERVYALDDQDTRHWLKMTPAIFEQSGRSWLSIFEINAAELMLYLLGAEITQ